MKRKSTGVLFLAVAVSCVGTLLITTSPLKAQSTERSIWEGVYTASQAERGKQLYGENCSRCHGQTLDGSDEAPSLKGAHFTSSWNGQTVSELVRRIKTTMPFDNPGKLGSAKSTDIAAYILSFGGAPAGGQELSSDPSSQMLIKIQPK
jgi:cytochrome c